MRVTIVPAISWPSHPHIGELSIGPGSETIPLADATQMIAAADQFIAVAKDGTLSAICSAPPRQG